MNNNMFVDINSEKEMYEINGGISKKDVEEVIDKVKTISSYIITPGKIKFSFSVRTFEISGGTRIPMDKANPVAYA